MIRIDNFGWNNSDKVCPKGIFFLQLSKTSFECSTSWKVLENRGYQILHTFSRDLSQIHKYEVRLMVGLMYCVDKIKIKRGVIYGGNLKTTFIFKALN